MKFPFEAITALLLVTFPFIVIAQFVIELFGKSQYHLLFHSEGEILQMLAQGEHTRYYTICDYKLYRFHFNQSHEYRIQNQNIASIKDKELKLYNNITMTSHGLI